MIKINIYTCEIKIFVKFLSYKMLNEWITNDKVTVDWGAKLVKVGRAYWTRRMNI